MAASTKPDLELEEAFAQKRMTRDLFGRLASYLRPYRRIFVLNLLFTLVATASQLMGPKFIQLGIDRYLTHWTDSADAYRGILLISALYLGNLICGWGLSVAQVKSAIQVGQGAMNDLRMAVFEHTISTRPTRDGSSPGPTQTSTRWIAS